MTKNNFFRQQKNEHFDTDTQNGYMTPTPSFRPCNPEENTHHTHHDQR